jgi:AcrR family transcriptional regulator
VFLPPEVDSVGKPPGLRERKQAQVKQAIFNAAMHLFSAQGFDQTTVEEIAVAAGVSRATYFNQFGTKEGVLRYYGQQLAARLIQTADGLAAVDPPLDCLKRLLNLWAEHTAENRDQVRLVYMYSVWDPNYLLTMTPARQALYDRFVNLVEAGQQAGQIRSDLPAGELTTHILAVHQSGLMAYVKGMSSLSAVLDSAWKFILGGCSPYQSDR